MAALLTEQEVARQLGVSVITLRTWRQRPPKGVAQLRYVKMGGPDNGSVRYRQEHLDQYIGADTHVHHRCAQDRAREGHQEGESLTWDYSR